MNPNSDPTHGQIENWEDLVVGNHTPVPLLDGTTGAFINLDSASTAPALSAVVSAVSRLMPNYGSVGRGGGWKSELCTTTYERSRTVVARFVGGDRPGRVAIFVKQTTDAINLVASQIPLSRDDVVACTVAEHHANLLPWRRAAERAGATLVTAGVDRETGAIRVDDLVQCLTEYGKRVKLVAITGASNVTGHIPAVHEIARFVHSKGALLLVDGAQLVPHRAVDVGAVDDPACIDFLAFSGHKMYAPYGAGLLLAPRRCIERYRPHQVGGAAVSWVTRNAVSWRGLPHLQEAGSPNLVGVVAMAAAVERLTSLGMDRVHQHEKEITEYALEKLKSISKLRLYGSWETDSADRLGVLTFNITGVHYHLVSAILAYEYGIATRSGAFCSHPYVSELVSSQQGGDAAGTQPGAVRASIGLFNTKDDIDALVAGLKAISAGDYSHDYVFDDQACSYRPTSWDYVLSCTVPAEWIPNRADCQLK